MRVHYNKNQTLLKPEFFKIAALQEGHIPIDMEEWKLLKKI
jgi:hypothetical protein